MDCHSGSPFAMPDKCLTSAPAVIYGHAYRDIGGRAASEERCFSYLAFSVFKIVVIPRPVTRCPAKVQPICASISRSPSRPALIYSRVQAPITLTTHHQRE